MLRPITIAGGGLAGLALGIALRREGVPVEIWEAADYPRHRVCGEFICGEGVRFLQEMNVLSPSAARNVQTVRFSDQTDESQSFRLPSSALSISRYVLDHAMAAAFVDEGGSLRTRSRWAGSFEQAGIVRATGRRVATREEFRLIGLKVHARNLRLAADLELHFSSAGYIGMNALPGGAVNVCGLFRTRDPLPHIRNRFVDLLALSMRPAAAERVREATFDLDSLAVVAGMSLSHQLTDKNGECRVGDSLQMIAPLSGNGMSIAFESASIAAHHLSAYSRGLIQWHEARQRISQQCEKTFAHRLRLSAFLQQLLFSPIAQSLLLHTLIAFPPVFRPLFWASRS